MMRYLSLWVRRRIIAEFAAILFRGWFGFGAASVVGNPAAATRLGFSINTHLLPIPQNGMAWETLRSHFRFAHRHNHYEPRQQTVRAADKAEF
jgi:hypothetical protein